MPHQDPSQMRISDADRHKVAELLRDAAGEGRLDLDELDERLEAAYAAKVYADLIPLTLDLPGQGAVAPIASQSMVQAAGIPQPAHAGPAPSWPNSTAVMGEVTRKGVWDVPITHTAFSMMGSITLDLREARFASQEVVITANAVMGEVTVVVNAGTHVIVEGTGVMGDFSQGRDRVPVDLQPGAPVVRVKGIAFMGAVTVVRKRMPGEPGKLKKMLGN